jgi:hypothetical protein
MSFFLSIAPTSSSIAGIVVYPITLKPEPRITHGG